MMKVHLIIKYTFFVSMVLGAGLTIERLVGIKHWWENDSFTADDIVYNVSSPLVSENFNSVLGKHYLKCLTKPAKPFCLLSSNRRLEIFRSDAEDSVNVEVIERRLHNLTSDHEPRRRQIHSLLIAFSEIMEANRVRIVLIEPSMLFCVLSTKEKFSMLSGGFNPGRLLGSRNVVTVGLLAADAKKLEEGNFTQDMLSSGFKIIKFQKWISDQESEKSFETVHYFFIMQDVSVHAVVFYPKNSYLWHAGFDPKEINFKGLLFVNESMYENFTLLPLNLNGSSISQVYLPHDIRYFMKEIESSRSVECGAGSVDNATSTTHANLTMEQLQKRAIITLKELKMVLASQTAIFWLWSQTLLGWYTGCDIFLQSSTLNLALTFKSVQGLNFSEALAENGYLRWENVNESNNEFRSELDCHGLLVNIFVLHEDKNGLWYTINEDHRLTYPVFPLCSSQIFGQKIHVPCDTDSILKLEEYNRNRTGDS